MSISNPMGGRGAETTIDDQEIIQQIRTGNADAFAHLVRKYQRRVRGYCLGVVGHSHQADDLAQEIFIKAFRALEKFRGEASFSTWLYHIAANHCRDYLRKVATRQPTESLDALLEQEGDKIEALIQKASIEQDRSSEYGELILRVLERVPPQAREILVLREVEGLSYQEISHALGCSLDAVKTRLRRARADLTEKLRHFLARGNV